MSPLSLIIADDQIDTADSLATLARLWGHDVHVCQDCNCILDCCNEHLPDAILLNLGFPRRCDGLQTAREIKSTPMFENLTIIAITGFSDIETRYLAKEAGCDHYLVKPADLEVLETLLKSLQGSLVVA